MTKKSKMIYEFLKSVDSDFPVLLSSKTDLYTLANKLQAKATICAEIENDRIIAMVAGYINDTTNKTAFLTVLATLPSARNRGLASKLIKEFIIKAKYSNMKLVHLYTDKTNNAAIKLYQKLGFVDYIIENEPRPNDLHFVYFIEE